MPTLGEILGDDPAERPKAPLSFGIPTLDDFVPLLSEENKVVVVALPWQPAGETSFVVAQAFARQGHNPLCVNPGWSPYWDGALDVYRLESPNGGGPIDYGKVKARTGGGQPVIIDQFSQLHYDVVKSHVEREDVVADAGRALHWLAWERQCPVVVFTRRRTRDVVCMSADDLRSDAALHADAVLMVDPHPKRETADLLVLKHRNGLTGAFPGVHWPNLPRTAAYRRT